MEAYTSKTPAPNSIKHFIPVKNHLPTPVPSPTCSGMFYVDKINN
jgi:hypothetical protein